MWLKASWVLLAFSLPAFAGCLTSEKPGDSLQAPEKPLPSLPVPIDDGQLGLTGLLFDPHVLIDAVRPGGEPVITVTPKGTILVSAHPGYTHTQLGHVDPNWPQSLSGENMMWRSTDHGKTWTYVGLPVVNAGPRDTAISQSDPDFTIDSAGNIYLVSLYIPFLSVSMSSDDGLTWIGNPLAEPLPFPLNDRPWIQAKGPGEVWIATWGNVWKSVDGSQGLAYQPWGTGPDGNWGLDSKNNVLYLGGGGKVSKSTDGGKTFKALPGAKGPGVMGAPYLELNEPVVDAAGNVYSVYGKDNQIHYTAWSAKGEAFLQDFQVTNLTGTHLWPWIVAGDEGRLGMVWVGSDKATSADDDVEWSLYAAIVENATTDTPTFHVNKATSKPIHKGPICQSGVGCVLGGGDRRIGDFLTADIDTDGRMVIASGGTLNLGSGADEGSHSHPLFVHQNAGPLLRASVKA